MAPRDKTPAPIVISASRRTDIPAFYMDWFMDRIESGTFEVMNPYNRRVTVVPAGPDRVHSVVFWSKNYGPFISGGYGSRLEGLGYQLFFNFTVNAPSRRLEPRVPPLTERLAQLAALARRFGPASVSWRFDPVCFYRTGNGPVRDSADGFGKIAEAAARCGVSRCITSFMDLYPKVRKRTDRLPGFTFLEPGPDRKIATLSRMARKLSGTGIRLYTCCEKEVLEGMDPGAGVEAASCIPTEHLMALYGGRPSLRRDPGQRRGQGCGCRISTDIGSYPLHPCFHDCLFCYANPAGRVHRNGAGTIVSGGPLPETNPENENKRTDHADRPNPF